MSASTVSGVSVATTLKRGWSQSDLPETKDRFLRFSRTLTRLRP